MKGVDVVRRPEAFFESLRFLVDLPQLAAVIDDDRPGPYAGCEQPEHDQLDDDVRLHEQRQRRQCLRSVQHHFAPHVRLSPSTAQMLPPSLAADRKSAVSGKSVSVRVDHGGRRIIKKKKKTKT